MSVNIQIKRMLTKLSTNYLANIIKYEGKEFSDIKAMIANARIPEYCKETVNSYEKHLLNFQQDCVKFLKDDLKSYIGNLEDISQSEMNTFVKNFQEMYLKFLKLESVEMSIRYFLSKRLDNMIKNLGAKIDAEMISEAYDLFYNGKVDNINDSSAKPFIIVYSTYILIMQKENVSISTDGINGFIKNIKQGLIAAKTNKFTQIFMVLVLLREFDRGFSYESLAKAHECISKEPVSRDIDLSDDEEIKLATQVVRKGDQTISDEIEIQSVVKAPTNSINAQAASINAPNKQQISEDATNQDEIINDANETKVVINKKPPKGNPNNDDRFSALMRTKNHISADVKM